MDVQQIEIKRAGDTFMLTIPDHILVQMDDATLDKTGRVIADGLRRRRDTARVAFRETIRKGSVN